MTDHIWWMPPNGALHGAAIDHLMWWNLTALTTLFLLAHIFLIAALFRTRKSGNDLSQLRWKFLPLAGLTLLYAWMAISAQKLWATIRFQGAAPNALQVEITGEQFQWYFRYPGADATFGLTRPELINAPAGNPLGVDRTDEHSADDIISSILILPAGHEVDLGIRSIDVIHGFFIPGMRVKQNAVPGMEMHIHFTPDTPGDYPILCSQVCGSGHARMQTHLQVVSENEYEIWLKKHAPEHLGATK
ncbi:cytochrome C oxidase subunit II [Acidobacterium sp. S8]|uniref:cytochrome C oxidase subunit II n=1 Tax=Acidobacterium sp. S8 TaxID=1641854 RepID=UPI00131D9671|nr:cytochrome C oxidase subunit II [Acidobacterium sp. S8]